MALETTTPAPSRRALLGAAIGAAAASFAATLSRPATVRAEGENIQIGGEYTTATSVTKITNQDNANDVFHAVSTQGGVGVRGNTDSNIGVWGYSTSGEGVRGLSQSGIGVTATSDSSYAIQATSNASVGLVASSTSAQGIIGTGIIGVEGTSNSQVGWGVGGANSASGGTGVWGQAEGSGSRAVAGYTDVGRGVYGEASESSGWAGYFKGRTFTRRYQEMEEISTPNAPGTNRARVFLRDNGSGKTQLCVRFHTGSVRVLATEP